MTARRAFLQWLGATPLVTMAPGLQAAPAAGKGHVRLQDDRLSLQFDDQMRSRIVHLGGPRAQTLTGFDASEQVIVNGKAVERFVLASAVPSAGVTPYGAGQRLVLTGRSADGIEKTLTVTLLDEHPGVALLDVVYTNRSARPIEVQGWVSGSHRLLASPRHAGGWWTYSGASHADRRDWVQPVKRGFEQRNFMGMNASDYGGGTPVVDVWRRDLGFAVGHLDKLPKLVSLPVKASGDQVDISLRGDEPVTLAPGAALTPPQAFIAVHAGDCFVPLDRYRRLMGAHGLHAPEPPRSAHDAIWCAWGYERDFSMARVRDTLPKAQALGLKWAVLDDGWQRMTGDWTLDPAKYPGGEPDMKALVADIHARGMKARLWIAPLAVAPGSDELHDHTDMLLLDKDGATQQVTWWNCFYICPSYDKTQQRIRDLVTKIIGEWGFDGLKIDGQHLNGVAPCYNPKHRHAKPEDSVEHLADFYRVMFDAAHAANPEAVVEICPCGTSYAFHNMPFIDQAPASDPLSSWQVRHKGKALKALMGRWSAYAGDHVELSTGGQDFASSVGIGAVVSTKFTWPVDPKPKDSFLLTPEHERHWRQWIDIHNERGLSEGSYRGDLYDIAFDKPETHVVEKNGVLHYAFYAPSYAGPVTLRGLGPGTWRVKDYVNGVDLGRVDSQRSTLNVRFKDNMLIEARLELPDERPVARSVRVPARLVGRDGFPVASQWNEAPDSFFAQDWRGRPLQGTQSTRVQFLHDDRTLYLRVISRYASLSSFEREASASAIWPLWERDVVELFLQAPQDAGTGRYLELEVAPNGLMLALQISADGTRKRLLDAARSRVAVDQAQRLWTAELAIPLAGQQGSTRGRDGWRLNLLRVEGQGEGRVYSAWSPTGTPKPDFHVPGAFGHLRMDEAA
ncbi:MAG: alpha-galactosidase [Burkholderiaceae bacterium]